MNFDLPALGEVNRNARPAMTGSMTEQNTHDIAALLALMARLRAPDDGCPWDLEQTFASIAPHTIEEAYEVAGAIEDQDWPGLKDELGDLLFQVVFHARMAEERGLFNFGDVVSAIVEKMVRRHPHIFGALEGIESAEAQVQAWEDHKKKERAARIGARRGLLDDIPRALPALSHALKLQKRAASVGFDWDSSARVLEKLQEEAAEIVEAQSDGAPREKLTDEVGDLLFVAVNLARHLKVDPEVALRGSNAKFLRRFRFIEAGLAARGLTPEQATLDDMEALWQSAKSQNL
jgi:MazG family protein